MLCLLFLAVPDTFVVWSFREYPSIWKQNYWNDKMDGEVSILQGTELSHSKISEYSCLAKMFSNDVPNLNVSSQFKKSLVHYCTNLRLHKCSPSLTWEDILFLSFYVHKTQQLFWQRMHLCMSLCSPKKY